VAVTRPFQRWTSPQVRRRFSNNAAMTARVVAFLDVLGFSAQVRSQSHEELVETYKALVGAAYKTP
jgi:hypothetical protein